MDKLARFMEFFWLALAIGSTLWAAREIYGLGWELGRVYIWFPLVCFAMYLYRRFTRKKMAQWAERKSREAEKP